MPFESQFRWPTRIVRGTRPYEDDQNSGVKDELRDCDLSLRRKPQHNSMQRQSRIDSIVETMRTHLPLMRRALASVGRH